jgi:uncharacterized membrane protein
MASLASSLLLLCALGTAVIGGAFFAFSTFVMGALARLVPAHGIAAMQSINTVVLNAVFLGAFLGTALLCAAAIVVALVDWTSATPAIIAGGLLYVIGTFGVTIAFNVPRNEALARLDASRPESEVYWRTYVRSWTRWNHVRTVASLAAAVSFMLALQ